MKSTHETDQLSKREFRQRSRRSFAILTLYLIAVVMGLNGLQRASLDRNLQWPLRKILDWNAQLGLAILETNRHDPAPSEMTIAPSSLRGKKARSNGDAGLIAPMGLETWRLTVVKQQSQAPSGPARAYDMTTIRSFPKTEITVEFKCIEGWSEVMSFGGTRFLDFVNQFGLATKSGSPIDAETRPEDLYRYVGLETPDGTYFVSIDMKSALNPRTLLAYEQNGEPLTPEHGAPLRLYIPNKYGVKSLKRIGRMTFTDVRPRDYWEDDGYDHFIGL